MASVANAIICRSRPHLRLADIGSFGSKDFAELDWNGSEGSQQRAYDSHADEWDRKSNSPSKIRVGTASLDDGFSKSRSQNESDLTYASCG